MYAVARLVLRDADLAQDATQDALVRAWRDLPALRDAERFDAWLNRLLVNACTDVARRRRRWRMPVPAIEPDAVRPDHAQAVADRDELERGLRRLTTGQQTVLVLHFYLGMAPAELAETLEIPVGTAKSRLHYAIEALRAALAAESRSAIHLVQEGRSA